MPEQDDVQDKAAEDVDAEQDQGTGPSEESDDGRDDLGDKGKQALDRMKEREREARRQLREYQSLGLSPAQIKALQDGSDDKTDVEQLREQTRAEVRREMQRDRVMDKIEAKAGARFSLDPEDVAALLLRRHGIDDFLDGDKIDAEAIQDALDELLEKRPNLAAQSGGRFKGGADGGTRKESRPAQLTRSDLKRMSPEEIVAAKKAGRLTDLLTPSK